jgi:purine-nucleoside phosphorylase
MIIDDHLNLFGSNPLIGPNEERFGPRFPDMTEVYSKRLRALAREVDPALSEGVYAAFRGPTYETPAEIRMLRTLGADMVGMSTVLEAIEARRGGADVLGVSLVTNIAAGLSDEPLDHEEVLAAGRASAGRMGALLATVLPKL